MLPVAPRQLSAGAFSLDDSVPRMRSGLFFNPSRAPTTTAPARQRLHPDPNADADADADTGPLCAKRKRALTRDSTYAPPWGPAPLDDSRYALASLIESPGAALAPADLSSEHPSHAQFFGEADYRRALGDGRIFTDAATDAAAAAAAAAADGAAAAPQSSWSRIPLLGTLGGVVGRVWQYCSFSTFSSVAFEGFSAGGGTGYSLDANAAFVPQPDAELDPRPSPRMPGQFPGFDAPAHTHTLPGPAVKRRQLAEPVNELKKNWVMVDELAEPAAPPAPVAAPRRGIPRLSGIPRSTLGSTTPRRTLGAPSRIPTAPTPLAPAAPSPPPAPPSPQPQPQLRRPRTYTTGSATAPAAPNISALRSSRPNSPMGSGAAAPSRIPVTSRNPFAGGRRDSVTRQEVRAAGDGVGRPRRQSACPAYTAAAPAVYRRNSMAAIGAAAGSGMAGSGVVGSGIARPKSRLGVTEIEASPRLDAVAKQLAAKKIIEERDADARMNSFNARLKEMIRQGQEALGATVEIDDVDMEGVEEDGWRDFE